MAGLKAVIYQFTKKIASSFKQSKSYDQIKYLILLRREAQYKKMDDSQKREALAKWYYIQTGETLDLDNPRGFNQKIQWLKIYDNIPEKTILSDKYLVRDWIKEKIGEQYLIPIFGAWDNTSDIDFDSLPQTFVLKANHGSGMNYVVKDKASIDRRSVTKMLSRWLRTPYDLSGMEHQYYSIPRKIIAEKYIEQMDGNLFDYKIHCFNGEPKIIQVIGDRDLIRHTGKECFFDTNWNMCGDMYHTYGQFDTPPEKPALLNEMLDIAKKLSKEFIYVRVDLYLLSDGIKFGEMTFTPASGIGKWDPKENDIRVGEMMNL